MAGARLAGSIARKTQTPRSIQQWNRRPAIPGLSRRRINPANSTQIPFHPQHHLLQPSYLETPLSQRRYASTTFSDKEPLDHTGLYDFHVANGGKMVPFAGYSMPVQYSDLSLAESHKWTREKASLFDVGHMVQHRVSGPLASSFLERITPTSIASLPTHHSTLSCLLHPATGGIVDDTVITRLGPETFYIVTNAACRQKDLAYLKEQIEEHCAGQSSPYPSTSNNSSLPLFNSKQLNWNVLVDWGLIALQGPLSASILQDVLVDTTDLKSLYFGQSIYSPLRSASSPSTTEDAILVSRAGYTGEDGFELSIPPSIPVDSVAATLLERGGKDRIRLAGLGARDSLRLEAGMCLYGHDLDDSTTPVEAGLGWVVGKERRSGGDFHGAETILAQLRPAKEGGGVDRKRVGLIVEGAPAREGAEIVAGEKIIGRVTSGCPSPTLRKNIAMGYVGKGFTKAGTQLEVLVRGKGRKAEVVRMPFVQAKYWKEEAAGKGTAPG